MRVPFSVRPVLLLATLLATISLVGCSDDPNQLTSVGVEPEVVNDPDVFQFQVSAVESHTGTLKYTWSNSGTLANVDQSCSIVSGRAILTVTDAAGAEVYSQDLEVDGSIATSAGAAGDWEVRIVFADMTGTVNFRLEKRTP